MYIKNFKGLKLVLIPSSKRIGAFWEEIENQLAGFSGQVVLDLVCSNGLGTQRFCVVHFNGSTFERSSKQYLGTVSKELTLLCDNFWKENLPENTFITEDQKKLYQNS